MFSAIAFPLHRLVLKKDIKKLERHLERLKEKDEDILFNELHLEKSLSESWPIYNAVATFPPDYKIAIMLLEAGTKPDLKRDIDELTLFHGALNQRYLSLFKLLVFYQPNGYKEIYDPVRRMTVQERINKWNKENPEMRVIETIDEATQDSLAIKDYRSRAIEAESKGKLELAANLYAKVGDFYKKHALAEMAPESHLGKKDIAEHFYYKKAYESYQKANELYEQIECMTQMNQESQLDVLNSLVTIARAINKPEGIDLYYPCLSMASQRPVYTINPMFSPV
ncbi:MAG: hypothetical protein K0R66_1579 [Gammaproteobacteria bacterium]|jgi:hypothetical protein|nr:hypothetical protein [Gammaproteobacteria bacterium]